MMELLENTEQKPVTKASSLLEGELPLCENKDLAWWTKRKETAWNEFNKLPMPSRRDEDWRFATVKAITLDDIQTGIRPTEVVSKKILDQSNLPFQTAGEVVFINDEQVSFKSISEELEAKGVIWKTLDEALIHHQELVHQYFMSQEINLGSKKFAALHDAMCRAGSFLYVPKNVEIPLPIVAQHWLVDENASVFPHTLIMAEDNSRLTFLDIYQSFNEEKGLACSVSDLYVAPGAHIKYVAIQNWSEKVLSFQINATKCEKDSASRSLYVNLGGKFARIENQSTLNGSGARSEMLAVSAAHDHQEYDQRTLQKHAAPHAWSDLLYKNALSNKARSIFSGLIKVEPGAAHTDAYQTNRNLLLNPLAEADSMPGLEILNDDVKCSHGATTGQIDETELFYMLARGIDPKTAKELIVQGFLEEVTTRLGCQSIESMITENIANKFSETKKINDLAEDTSSAPDEEINIRKLQGLED